MSGQRKKPTQPTGRAKPHDPKPGPVVKSAQAQATSTQKLRSESIRGSREAARQRYEKNRREMRIIRIGGGILAALLVIAIGYGVFNWADDRENSQAPEKAVADYTYAGSQHSAEPQTYTEHPPVGGVHNDVWQNCGYYAQPIMNEHAVHSLEHGAVWITYDPALPQDQVDRLKNIAEEQDYILVSPVDGLTSPVVASSWNHQIQLEGANDPDLMRFISNYKQGPDTPEPGALCTRGTSDLAMS
jgi:hypothetical protein